MKSPPRSVIWQFELEFRQADGVVAMVFAYSWGMKVSCSHPRIESKPPMKNSRSGYVQDVGGDWPGRSWRSLKSQAATFTFSPRRSSAAKVMCLVIGM